MHACTACDGFGAARCRSRAIPVEVFSPPPCAPPPLRLRFCMLVYLPLPQAVSHGRMHAPWRPYLMTQLWVLLKAQWSA